MKFLGWMYDIARDQSPQESSLLTLIDRTADAGFSACGLYLEHRFAYASAPWAQGAGCLTPDVARRLAAHAAARRVRVIPFLNTLGHMEGFLHSAGGEWLREGAAEFGAQMCPSNPAAVEFARGLVQDALECFDNEWIHLGGDETRQLGQCPKCAARVASIGKAGLYGEYFGALCRWTLARGRRPCLWADMLLQHPEALAAIPRETILFDWQYEQRPRATTAKLRAAGFDVVCCPSVHSYDAAWLHAGLTQRGIDEHSEDAAELGALGVLITTWEFTYFSAFDSIAPFVFAAGARLSRGAAWGDALRQFSDDEYVAAAALLGEQVPGAAPFLAAGAWRRLREHLVMRHNPFSIWWHWREEASGAAGNEILRLLDRLSPQGALELPIVLHRIAIDWTRRVERAAQHYSQRDASGCVEELLRARQSLALLRGPLERVAARGGSRADLARLDGLLARASEATERVATLSPSAAWPAFDVLCHARHVPGDQAAWRASGL